MQSLEDMPKTFMRYFYIGAALRWIMTDDAWPEEPEFQEMVAAFKAAAQDVARGTRVVDFLSFHTEVGDPTAHRSGGQQRDLDRTTYDALLSLINSGGESRQVYASRYERLESDLPFLPHAAEYMPSINHLGITLACSEHSKRNSFILFRNDLGALVAGQIKEIICHTRLSHGETIAETFLVVDEFMPLSKAHAPLDPFRPFPDVYVWLCYNRLRGIDNVVRLNNVVSHFAAYIYTPDEIGEECIVVKSLDRV